MTKEEAIEVYKGLINVKIKEAFEFFVPELRESEDERIREGLCDIVEYMPYMETELRARGLTVEKTIAYLEKQKEQTEDLFTRLNGVMQEYVKAGKDEEEQEHRLKCYQLFWDALGDSKFFEEKEQKSIKWDELTWEDINDLESIINEVHSDFRAGIGEKSFGLEVLERFRYNKDDENLDTTEPKFKVGDEIRSVDGQYEDTVLEVLSDGSYRLKNLGLLSIPENEWELANAPVNGYELIDKKEQKPVDDGTREKIISRATSEKQVVLVSESDGNPEIGWDTRSLEDARNLLEYGILFINKQLGVKPAEWSEEDEDYLTDVKCAVYDYFDEGYAEELWGRLKSLRPPQYCENCKLKRSVENWKPSEEQIGALNYAYCELFKRGDVGHNILGSLQNIIDTLRKL